MMKTILEILMMMLSAVAIALITNLLGFPIDYWQALLSVVLCRVADLSSKT